MFLVATSYMIFSKTDNNFLSYYKTKKAFSSPSESYNIKLIKLSKLQAGLAY